MKLVDRYVYAVVRRLPEKQRADVARELTAEISDMVEDRLGGKISEKRAIREVLIELGNPQKFADRYQERPRYVVGPEYYDMYVTLLKTISVVVLPLLAFIVFMTESMSSTHSVLSILLHIVGTLFEVAVQIFFWVTISFMLVQKFLGVTIEERWTPDDLPELPPEQEITRNEAFFGISWSVFAVIATLYQVPFIYHLIGSDTVPQFFSPTMWPGWTLGLLAVALLGLFAELMKLYIGGWTKMMVGLITFINIITVGFFIAILQYAQPIANPEMLELIGQSLGREDITQSVEQGIRIFVFVVIIISVYEVGEAVYRYKKGVKR